MLAYFGLLVGCALIVGFAGSLIRQRTAQLPPPTRPPRRTPPRPAEWLGHDPKDLLIRMARDRFLRDDRPAFEAVEDFERAVGQALGTAKPSPAPRPELGPNVILVDTEAADPTPVVTRVEVRPVPPPVCPVVYLREP